MVSLLISKSTENVPIHDSLVNVFTKLDTTIAHATCEVMFNLFSRQPGGGFIFYVGGITWNTELRTPVRWDSPVSL
jgi:hypothetical protein